MAPTYTEGRVISVTYYDRYEKEFEFRMLVSSVGCPTCKRSKGHRCRKPNGKLSEVSHHKRRIVFAKQAVDKAWCRFVRRGTLDNWQDWKDRFDHLEDVKAKKKKFRMYVFYT